MIRKCFYHLTAVLLLALCAAPAIFAEDAAPKPDEAVIARGSELFNAKEGLGVKYACISCHKGEKAIKKSSVTKLGDKLPSAINKYITGKSKGDKALEPDSADMKALEAYIRFEHAK